LLVALALHAAHGGVDPDALREATEKAGKLLAAPEDHAGA
jgi:hypothetical protein